MYFMLYFIDLQHRTGGKAGDTNTRLQLAVEPGPFPSEFYTAVDTVGKALEIPIRDLHRKRKMSFLSSEIVVEHRTNCPYCLTGSLEYKTQGKNSKKENYSFHVFGNGWY